METKNKNSYKDTNFWNKKKITIRSDILVTPKVIDLLKENNLNGKKILDLGCGDGSITNHIWECGAKTVGVDNNKKLINSAKRNYKGKFKVLDVSKKIPFKDESFDIIYSSMTFLHLDKKGLKNIYSEIGRVLKKNGKFIMSNVHPYSLLFKGKPELVEYLDKQSNYFDEESIRKAGLFEIHKVSKTEISYYHHQMCTLLNLARRNNLSLKLMLEPKPIVDEIKKYGKTLNFEEKNPSYIILEFEKIKSNYEITLEEIETLEKTWRYYLNKEENKKHSFGRVPEDGNEIAFWSVPKRTAEFLKNMVEFTDAKLVLELGASAGYSTLHMAKALEKTKGHIYTTEILKPKIKLSKKYFKMAGLQSRITLIEKDILSVLKNWSNLKKLDIVFMDADKERYGQYYEMILPILKKGGLIIVDNAGKVAMPDGRMLKNNHIEQFRKKVLNDERVYGKFCDVDNGVLIVFKK